MHITSRILSVMGVLIGNAWTAYCCSYVLSIEAIEGMENDLAPPKIGPGPYLGKDSKQAPQDLDCVSQVDSDSGFYSGSGQAVDRGVWPFAPARFDHPVQSPVDVVRCKATTLQLPLLHISDPPMADVQAKLFNSGNSVFIYVKDDSYRRPCLHGGPLKRKYIFEQMHFHWGREDVWGSEHFIDGESFSVEGHMVFWNSKYKFFEEAANHTDGLAVMAIFAEAYNGDNPLLEPLYSRLPEVQEARSSVLLGYEDAMQWACSALHLNREYFTYPGSLTTPPHSENVIWFVLPTTVTLSARQLSGFRMLRGDNGNIEDNKRNLQPLHCRPLIRSTCLK